MDYRKIAASSNTETRDVMKLSEPLEMFMRWLELLVKELIRLA